MKNLLPPLCYWIISTLIIFIALEASQSFLHKQQYYPSIAALVQMDGAHYQLLTLHGYDYNPNERSNVAFFPAFPLSVAVTMQLTHAGIADALLIVSNGFLLATLCLMTFWGLQRYPNEHKTLTEWSVLLLSLFPSVMFLRAAYAESMLTFLMVCVLIGILHQWPAWILALLAGLASATRPVGIAVSIALCWYVLFNNNNHSFSADNRIEKKPVPAWIRLVHLTWIFPLSCWGLLAYMIFLWYKFDAPLAFAQTQEHWTFLAPIQGTWTEKIYSLVTLEPIRGVYDADSSRYWAKGESHDNPLFSCLFWNPIFYLFSWFLIGLGWWKRWLKDYEIVLSVGLLLIPYVTRAYEMSMASHARFAAVVIPQYFVLGRLFAMMPPAVAGCLCGLMGLMMGLWTALFVAGYRFF